MRIFFILLVIFMTVVTGVAQAADKYPSVTEIPAPLLRQLRASIFIERYIADALGPIRQHAEDKRSLTVADVDRLEAAAAAAAQKSQQIMLLRYDADNDTNVTAEEIRQSIEKELRNYNRDDAETRLATLAERRINEVMALDSDKDGKLSYREMGAARMEKRYGGREFSQLRDLLALDPNGDGSLTAAELEVLARKAFATVDGNSDGEISRDETAPAEEAKRAEMQNQSRLARAREEQAGMADCKLSVAIPKDLVVYGGGAYAGQPANREKDDEGHRIGEIDVKVDLPGKTVGLVLGAYDPVVWKISATAGTVIHSVVLGGYHNQVAEGLAKDVPVIVNSHLKKGPCKYFYFKENDAAKLNPIAQQVYGRDATLFVPARDGKLLIDAKSAEGDSAVKPVVRESSNPLLSPGPAGELPNYKRIMHLKNINQVIEDVKAGFIRPASGEDAEAWRNALVEHELRTHALGLPPVPAGQLYGMMPPFNIMLGNSFVVLKEYKIPPGFGGNFLVPKGVPAPKDPAGSMIYNMNTMTCAGGHGRILGWEGVGCKAE